MTSSPKRTKWHDPIVILTACLVVVGAFQVAILRRQTDISRQEASILEKTIEMSRNVQRARVCLANITNHGALKAREPAFVQVHWKNAGGTPAAEVHATAHWAFQPIGSDLDRTKASKLTERSSGYLGPGIPLTSTLTVVPTPDNLSKVSHRKEALRVWAEVTYMDTFDQQHKTTMAAQLNHVTGLWELLNEYNSAD
ncbi:MAG: hypothetical protein GTO55_01560 [Armatimonadetes bacterium]|nr:hypothetical protein [Armatimonadota bacterium]NIM22964.1 hypothetical protein [Armatimonadota bacterium]NIM66835.1 hypothetical protein [Armatimonadota bacterium]NIM75376.1 hypothetical protein [Armatimonadota bacterium]NIN05023.1 hypothetical protein [Armatimonadota bacterium]